MLGSQASSVEMTSKVGLGSQRVGGLWMAGWPNGPLCSACACACVGGEEVLGVVEGVRERG